MNYSKRTLDKILSPKHVGAFSAEGAENRSMHLAHGLAGSMASGRCVAIYCLVDPEDGVIADVLFQAYGPPLLVAFAESASELLLRKNYDQAQRISGELIEKNLSSQKFPKESASLLNLVQDAIEEACASCAHLPLPSAYVVSPLGAMETEMREYPGWDTLTSEQKLYIIEEVINADILPYIQLDAGGVKVLELKNGLEVIIAYQGSCTSCISSTGSTLSAIQQILRTKVHKDLVVTPDPSFLSGFLQQKEPNESHPPAGA